MVNRRLLLVVLAAVALLGLAAWLRRRDDAGLPGGWRPPRVSVGRDQNPVDAFGRGRAPEWGVVSCAVDAALGDDPGRLIARGGDNQTVTARQEGRELTMELEPGEWTLSWRGAAGDRPAESRRLGLMEVEAGEVARCSIGPRGWTVTGEVRDLHGELLEGELVEGCGASTHTDESGRFSLVVSRGDCLIRAWALDGMLRRPSEPVYFSPFDVPASPTFRVDTTEIGGVGLGLVGTNRGLRVSMVVDGGPGSRSGIEVGDVIVTVDHAPVRGWTVEAGVEAITGPPGTRVQLGVERGEATQTYGLVRERVETTEEPATRPDTGNVLAP